MIEAAAKASVARAATILPDLPARCREHMGRAYPALTEKPRNTQLRWEYSADAVDRQIDDCAAFYDDTKREFAKKETN